MLDAVLDLLRASGCRVTTSRRLLIGTLLDLSNHISAEQLCDLIQQKAPDISISTIYRNLEELERLEIVMHSHLGHGPAVYHLAWAAYAHLVCSECGATLEIPEELFADLATQAAVRYGFTVDPRHFAILGQCRRVNTHESHDQDTHHFEQILAEDNLLTLGHDLAATRRVSL